MNAIKIIEKSKQTHQNWLDYFNRNPKSIMLKEYENIGDIDHHKKYIKEYDEVIIDIKQLQAEKKRLKTIIIEAKVCAATLCLVGIPSQKGLKEIALILNQGIDKGDIQQALSPVSKKGKRK